MSEDRFLRAMGAPAAPARDPRFTLAVLERAERDRTKAEALQVVVRSLGLAGLAGAALVALSGVVIPQAGAVDVGVLGAAGLLTLVTTARTMARLMPAR